MALSLGRSLSQTLLRSKYSTASQLRAGRDSFSVRLTNLEGAHVSCVSEASFLLVRPRVFKRASTLGLHLHDKGHSSPSSYIQLLLTPISVIGAPTCWTQSPLYNIPPMRVFTWLEIHLTRGGPTVPMRGARLCATHYCRGLA